MIYESFRETVDTFCFGSAVYNVLSLDAANLVPRTLRSVTSILDPVSGSLPWHIPETVVTPVTTISDVFTVLTVANTGSVKLCAVSVLV